jgi:predicted DNA-binding ribbon-helix-helix protein
MRKRSVVIAGHATSISIEDAFFSELKRMAAEAGIAVGPLIARIDAARRGENLSSAVRLAVLADLRAKAGMAGDPAGD